jgi:alkylmercury lyase
MTKEIKASMDQLLVDGYLKENPPELQRVILAIYQRLATGAQVTPEDIGALTRLEPCHVRELLQLVPASAIERNGHESITGFIGLSILPSRHEFHVEGRKLYTWCAFDALFLPELIAKPATIISPCPASGKSIEIELDANGLSRATPQSTVMSIVSPKAESYKDDLQGAFCCHVNFFAGEDSFAEWAEGRVDVAFVSLAEAHEMARSRNQCRFPDITLHDLESGTVFGGLKDE